MDPARLIRRSEYEWEFPRHGAMRVPGIIFADEALIRGMDDKVCEQVANVAALPGIVKASYAMPDAHWGYGFPIGGVAAFDPDDGGVVSAGGVGFDISCGVRTLLTGVTLAQLTPVKKALAKALYDAIPAGVGSTGALRLTPSEMDAMLEGGARWAVERGYGRPEDLDRIEERGAMAGARAGVCVRCREAPAARRDGNARLGQPLSRSAAYRRDLRSRCGRRVRARSGRHRDQHPLRLARPRPPDRHRVPARDGGRGEGRGHRLPDRELACAPIRSALGERYLGAMRAAINCALANRQILTHLTRDASSVPCCPARSSRCSTMSRTTRARSRSTSSTASGGDSSSTAKGRRARFRPGHPDLPPRSPEAGQPVLIGGSMGTASYILAGTRREQRRSVRVRLSRRRPQHEPARGHASAGRGARSSTSSRARRADPQPVAARRRRGGSRRLQGRHRASSTPRRRRSRARWRSSSR